MAQWEDAIAQEAQLRDDLEGWDGMGCGGRVRETGYMYTDS